MTHHVNAYTLSERTPKSGTAVVFPKPGHPELRLGNAASQDDTEYRRVLLGVGGEDLPVCVLDQMMSCQPKKLPGDHQTHLVSHKNWTGIVVRIIAKNLDFGLKPLATSLFFWPGGEDMRGHWPLARFGRPKDPVARDELFAINEGQDIFVGDIRGNIIVLSCKNGVPVTRPAQRDEVLTFVFNYGMNASRNNTGAIRWALHNLFALGALSQAHELSKHVPSMLTDAQRERLKARHGT